MKYEFGTFILDDERFELSREGETVPVEPQVFDVLSHLLRNRDRVVTRDELIETIWNGRFISDAALSSRIHDVRAAVGDTGKAQGIIKTIHGRGFRFVSPVSSVEPDPLPTVGAVKTDFDAIRQDVRYFKSFDGTPNCIFRTGQSKQ